MTILRPILLCLSLVTIAGFAGGATAGSNPPFAMHPEPRKLPPVTFKDADGAELSIESFRGRTILLNVWATWCPPCVKEMPTLDRLEATLGGPNFEVVALSVDSAGIEPVRKFYSKIDVQNLKLYIDETARSAAKLRALGLPVTLLIDPEGREIGRLIGPAEWDSPEIVAFLRGHIK